MRLSCVCVSLVLQVVLGAYFLAWYALNVGYDIANKQVHLIVVVVVLVLVLVVVVVPTLVTTLPTNKEP